MLEAHSQSSLVKRSPLPDNTVIQFEDFTASWRRDDTHITLRGINVSIQKGLLYMVTGPMGSGKVRNNEFYAQYINKHNINGFDLNYPNVLPFRVEL